MAVDQEVRAFIVSSFLFGQNESDLGNDSSFLESGLIDSTGVLELVSFLETTYGVTVEDDELVPDNLDSVNRVVAFVNRKLQAKTAGAAR